MTSSHQNTKIASEAYEKLSFRRYSLKAEGSGTAEIFSQQSVFIGSARGNDFVCEDPTVSRSHAKLSFEDGAFMLTDLGSKNGIKIGPTRIKCALLTEPCWISLGDYKIFFDLEREIVELELMRSHQLGSLIGKSPRMREIFALIQESALRPGTVLIVGPPGSGKESIAECIHQLSEEAESPLILFDCDAAALENQRDTLYEMLLEASGGNVLLHHLENLGAQAQQFLAACLKEGAILREGHAHRTPLPKRIIATSLLDLSKDHQNLDFSSALLWQLSGLKLKVPALHQRPEDIPLLVEFFLRQMGSTDLQISWETLQKLQAYAWPGNITELKAYVKRATSLAASGRLETKHLQREGTHAKLPQRDAGGGLTWDPQLPYKEAKAALVEDFERRYWQEKLEESEGNISEAARKGKIHRKSLEYLIKKLQMDV